ncbi:MAG: hypothetical protein MUE49_00910 [Rhodospirillales bacterium]|jgi:hypothetical protein|nr:hypothetical protein [Rhodospirillales bacterium]
MTTHAYPPSAAIADGSRAALGIAIAAAPLLFAQPAPVITGLLIGLLLAFLGLGVSTLHRHLGRVVVDAEGLSVNRRRLPWSEVRGIRLAYFSTRRDRDHGWFQLTLTGRDRRLCIDSALDGFLAVAKRAALAADTNGIAVDAATRANFDALAIPLPRQGAG